jgi:hypothetical protein
MQNSDVFYTDRPKPKVRDTAYGRIMNPCCRANGEKRKLQCLSSVRSTEIPTSETAELVPGKGPCKQS